MDIENLLNSQLKNFFLFQLKLSVIEKLNSLYTEILSSLVQYSFIFDGSPTKTKPLTQDPTRDGGNWYGYCRQNPLIYTDPTGLFNWSTGEIEKGDTLSEITVKFNSIYETNYSVDDVASGCNIPNKDFIKTGDKIDFSNILPTWNVTGNGSGGGFFISAIPYLSNMSEIDKSWYNMTFVIEESKESFSQKFSSLNTKGNGLKLGAGFYTNFIEAQGVFKGKKPTQKEIISTFEGTSEIIGFSLFWIGINGSENDIWTVTTGTIGNSKGLPFSYGFEESTTTRKEKY